MKKAELRAELASVRALLEAERNADRDELYEANQKVRALTAQVEQMKEHWRPVPITHQWQPRDPRCALCDEPKDAARHQMVG